MRHRDSWLHSQRKIIHYLYVVAFENLQRTLKNFLQAITNFKKTIPQYLVIKIDSVPVLL